ncbi:hypothetical protein CWM52_13370 [Raoultella sp. T31]|nr:hypothetical protein CWM52_13370 [Raoultella sp. T31]
MSIIDNQSAEQTEALSLSKNEYTASIISLNDLVNRVKIAQAEFAKFPQEKVDKIFRAAALAAAGARIPLAKMAVAESGMGIVSTPVLVPHTF